MHAKKSRLPSVPVFHLYGETGSEAAQELVHCESIASRSRLHNWEIQPHRHHGLFQMLWLARGRADVAIDDGDGRLSAGQVLLLPQHCVHGFRFAPGAAPCPRAARTIAQAIRGAMRISVLVARPPNRVVPAT